jgi:hypothetical protein
MDAEFVEDGYIRVYQDIRGLHRSEGAWVMNRPLAGRSTTRDRRIDRRVRHHRVAGEETSGVERQRRRHRLYLLGFTTLMAEINPHPALKAAVPQSPMVDGWMGDDWFHNGAFRVSSLDYVVGLSTKKGEGGGEFALGDGDDYTRYLEAGSCADFAKMLGIENSPACASSREPGIHGVLVAAGRRQVARGASAHGAHDDRSRPVGPGRQLRRPGGLPRARAQGQEQRQGVVAHRPVAPLGG